MYFVVIFVSPAYFLVRKKWGGFVLNAILYLLAIFTIFFGIGVVFWALGVGHAIWHLRKEHMLEQAEMIAQKMVEANKAAGSEK